MRLMRLVRARLISAILRTLTDVCLLPAAAYHHAPSTCHWQGEKSRETGRRAAELGGRRGDGHAGLAHAPQAPPRFADRRHRAALSAIAARRHALARSFAALGASWPRQPGPNLWRDTAIASREARRPAAPSLRPFRRHPRPPLRRDLRNRKCPARPGLAADESRGTAAHRSRR